MVDDPAMFDYRRVPKDAGGIFLSKRVNLWMVPAPERQILSCILRQCSKRLGITLRPGGLQAFKGSGRIWKGHCDIDISHIYTFSLKTRRIVRV